MRELMWMHDGMRHEAWNHTAKICEILCAVNGKQVDPGEFHPDTQRQIAEGLPATEENLQQMDAAFESLSPDS